MTTFAATPMFANLAPMGAMLPFPDISIRTASLDDHACDDGLYIECGFGFGDYLYGLLLVDKRLGK